MKKVLITLDEACLAILNKYHSWGTSKSSHVRRALLAYERRSTPPIQSWDGIDELS